MRDGDGDGNGDGWKCVFLGRGVVTAVVGSMLGFSVFAK